MRKTDVPLAVTADGKRPSHDDGRLPDEIRFVKFSTITWTHDSKGFFYQRFPDRATHGSVESDLAGTETEDDRNAMLYYHRVGTPQSKCYHYVVLQWLICSDAVGDDVLILENKDEPDWQWDTAISEVDGRYLELYISKDTSRASTSPLYASIYYQL